MSNTSGSNDTEFLRQLRLAFQVEAGEHLQTIISGLLELEKAEEPSRRHEIFTQISREAHSLKGAARSVDLGDVEAICQSLEGVFGAARQQAARPSTELLDSLHIAVRAIERNLTPAGSSARSDFDSTEHAMLTTPAVINDLDRLEIEIGSMTPVAAEPPRAASDTAPPTTANAAEDSGSGPTPAFDAALAEGAAAAVDVPLQLHDVPLSLGAATPSVPMGFPARPINPLADTLRVSTAKLDALLLQAEEMLSEKQNAAQRATELRDVVEMHEAARREWARLTTDLGLNPIAAESACADSDTSTFDAKLGRLITAIQSQAAAVHGKLDSLLKAVQRDRRVTASMIDTLVEGSKKLLMLPAATLLESFHRLVRELSRELGKEVELTARGGEVEVDKRILEEMKDPLMHLLRNSIDHGIEFPRERAMRGKASRGTILISVSQVDGNKVQFLVQDDGAGIDPQAVRAAAVQRGVINEESAGQLSDLEAAELIFRPEVSTSPKVTEVSGRGMGMGIVKSKAQLLGGRVETQSEVGVGTSFRIVLPLTLATFRGIVVRSAGQLFILPTNAVERVIRIKNEEFRTIEHRESIPILGKPVSFVRLDDVLELNSGAANTNVLNRDGSTWISVVVVSFAESRIAFQVDEVLNEQEVLFKRLGAPLARVRNVAGATVLGTGRAIPVLNVQDLLTSASSPDRIRSRQRAAAGAVVNVSPPPVRTGSILLVEDSITARMLEKSILESAGHQVKTAVDGLDALTILKTADFDLVVSDVEMPRLDGFELTAKIRADARLADVPVILVTALSTRENREKGAEVGANAYIVKGNFNHSDLLDAVQRLL